MRFARKVLTLARKVLINVTSARKTTPKTSSWGGLAKLAQHLRISYNRIYSSMNILF